MPKEGEAKTCKSVAAAPLLIRGSLLSPVQLTPAYVNGPMGHDRVGCAAVSKSPSWEMGATQFNRRTRYNKDGAVTTRSIFLQVINNATGYTAGCIGYLTNDPGFQRLECEGQAPFQPREKYHIRTDASFDPDNFALAVNETWFCDDVDPAAP